MKTEKKAGFKFNSGQSIKVMLLPFKQENTDHYRVTGQSITDQSEHSYDWQHGD